MWDSVIIGSGNRGNSAYRVFAIEGDHFKAAIDNALSRAFADGCRSKTDEIRKALGCK